MLSHFNPTKPIRIETDASDYAGGADMSQQMGEGTQAHWHPVPYWSKKWNPVERNYGTPNQEMLGIFTSMAHWRHYLGGCRVSD